MEFQASIRYPHLKVSRNIKKYQIKLLNYDIKYWIQNLNYFNKKLNWFTSKKIFGLWGHWNGLFQPIQTWNSTVEAVWNHSLRYWIEQNKENIPQGTLFVQFDLRWDRLYAGPLSLDYEYHKSHFGIGSLQLIFDDISFDSENSSYCIENGWF